MGVTIITNSENISRMKDMSKTIDTRLNKGAIRYLELGETVTYINEADVEDKVDVVLRHRVLASSFKLLYQLIPIEQLGISEDCLTPDLYKSTEMEYCGKDIDDYGCIALIFELKE